MAKKFVFTLSVLYLMLLVYNLFAAQFISSAISLLMFLLTCPLFFKKIKIIYPVIGKIAIIAGWIPLAFLIIAFSAGIINGNSVEIPPEEQLYIDTVLSQITSETTKEEVIELLGKPSRDLGMKVNWWVSFNNKNSRVGVYFSPNTGKAEEIVLDGGWGRFYYRKSVLEQYPQ